MADKPDKPLAVRAAEMLKSLDHVTHLSIEEKSVHALGLAATPDERWQILERNNRSLGFWVPLQQGKTPPTVSNPARGLIQKTFDPDADKFLARSNS